jgi:hypothetical protein
VQCRERIVPAPSAISETEQRFAEARASAQGEAKGKTEGEAAALLKVLRARGLHVDEAAEAAFARRATSPFSTDGSIAPRRPQLSTTSLPSKGHICFRDGRACEDADLIRDA